MTKIFSNEICERLRRKWQAWRREVGDMLVEKWEDNDRRFQRAISWFCHSQKASKTPQEKFIFLWMAFDAAYSDGRHVHPKNKSSSYDGFLKGIYLIDQGEKCSEALQKCRSEISHLFDLRQAFNPFWRAMYDEECFRRWENQFNSDNKRLKEWGAPKYPRVFFPKLFDRLHVVRNQLLHGAMTEDSHMGKTQIKCGVKIMEALVPCMIEIMLDNRINWGHIPYPPVGKSADEKCQPRDKGRK